MSVYGWSKSLAMNMTVHQVEYDNPQCHSLLSEYCTLISTVISLTYWRDLRLGYIVLVGSSFCF